jgi:ABC-type branched-subunit amino acid transport system substrate-binding protein
MVAPFTGPTAESGQYEVQGAKLAVDEINKAAGSSRRFELVFEDNQDTNPGTVLAFSKLAGNPEFAAFIGPIRSTQIHAMEPDVLKLGKPVLIGGTDPALTHVGNPWFFRFRPNDIYSARVIADYGVKVLGKRKWAIVYSTDAFGTGGMKSLVESLKGLGIERALYGSYAVADFNKDSSEIAKAFSARYEAAYKLAPDFFSSWTYDAVRLLARAIGDAKNLEPGVLREAILAVKGYEGAEGIYNFDKNGDGLHGYNIVKNNNGTIVFDKHIDFDD